MEGINKNSEKNKLYPERALSGMEEKIENLQKVISGEIPAWEISETERAEILGMESQLASELVEVESIRPVKVSFNFSYLQTEAGLQNFKETFKEVFDEGPQLDINTEEDLQAFLDKNLERFYSEVTTDNVPEGTRSPKERLNALKDHGGKAESALEVRIFEGIRDEEQKKLVASREGFYAEERKVADEAWNTAKAALEKTYHDTKMMDVSLTPDLLEQKLVGLHDLKSKIKQQREKLREKLAEGQASPDYKSVLDGILEMYQRKINEILPELAHLFAGSIKKGKMKLAGIKEDSIKPFSPEEIDSLTEDGLEGRLARYDKFATGVSTEAEDSDWDRQVGPELTVLADELEGPCVAAELGKEEAIKAKGLDSKKIDNIKFTPEEVERLCQETLEHYGLLSTHPASEYAEDREGAAPDNKWQIIVSDAYESLAVNGVQKVIKCPKKPQDIDKLLRVTIAHEIEGHALQHENRANSIALELFKRLGADRSLIFAEAGAARNEDYFTTQAFGYLSPAEPHYIRAMVRKQEGGTYAECLDAFYQSYIKVEQIQFAQGKIDEKEFKEKCDKKLKHAINRARRLFRYGASKTKSYPHLTESKATVYLEQEKLAEKLKEVGLDTALNLTNINLDAMAFLLRAGFMKMDKIKAPDYYSLEIWNRLKAKYELNSTSN